MRGVPAHGGVCGGGTSAGRDAQSDSSRDEKSKKAATVNFGGADGKVLTFVVASTEGVASQADESAPTWKRLWKRKAAPSTTDKADSDPHITPDTVADVKESDEKAGPSNADDSVDGGPTKRAKQAPTTIAQPPATAKTDTELSSSDDYFKKEDEFMLRQELEKSKLRVKDGRGTELDNLLVSGTPVTSVVDLFDGDDHATLLQHLELLKAHMHFCEDDNKRSLIKALETIVNSRLLGDVAGEVSESVSSKINSILSTKSVSELEGYESEIKKKMTSDDVVDTNFWEAVLSRIPFFKACCVVREYNNGTPAENVANSNVKPVTPKAPASRADGSARVVADPKYERFMKSLKLETDEHILTEDVPYGNSSGQKPRFAARVTLSYEWSSYNLSHFDPNNPPPKSVQGFKFSIFFSKLENPRAVPQWKLAKDGTSTDTCLLVFKGGRPYAPVAFRIPAREWDTDPSRGFKNCFSEGVLHLYFNFRRLVYRR
ncbi:cactin domain-containing protein [Babesia ovata]|uniref:Splicing factor Cactin n=1 Tax=Babesia ovata TaxID=189622 RepID=A0A2H6KHP2_9APIC|nr:cactin domain-containing protein [Babesia ovata]GBE62510.1 cactin domain-containing protein [Babesia ovata]